MLGLVETVESVEDRDDTGEEDSSVGVDGELVLVIVQVIRQPLSQPLRCKQNSGNCSVPGTLPGCRHGDGRDPSVEALSAILSGGCVLLVARRPLCGLGDPQPQCLMTFKVS